MVPGGLGDVEVLVLETHQTLEVVQAPLPVVAHVPQARTVRQVLCREGEGSVGGNDRGLVLLSGGDGRVVLSGGDGNVW